jgi:hypothetical protein
MAMCVPLTWGFLLYRILSHRVGRIRGGCAMSINPVMGPLHRVGLAIALNIAPFGKWNHEQNHALADHIYSDWVGDSGWL